MLLAHSVHGHDFHNAVPNCDMLLLIAITQVVYLHSIEHKLHFRCLGASACGELRHSRECQTLMTARKPLQSKQTFEQVRVESSLLR